MAVTVEMQNTGDPALLTAAIIEHVLSDRPGDWRVFIVGSRTSDRWEMKITGPNAFERSYALEWVAGSTNPKPSGGLLRGWCQRLGEWGKMNVGLSTRLQKYLLNPPIKLVFAMGLAPNRQAPPTSTALAGTDGPDSLWGSRSPNMSRVQNLERTMALACAGAIRLVNFAEL